MWINSWPCINCLEFILLGNAMNKRIIMVIIQPNIDRKCWKTIADLARKKNATPSSRANPRVENPNRRVGLLRNEELKTRKKNPQNNTHRSKSASLSEMESAKGKWSDGLNSPNAEGTSKVGSDRPTRFSLANDPMPCPWHQEIVMKLDSSMLDTESRHLGSVGQYLPSFLHVDVPGSAGRPWNLGSRDLLPVNRTSQLIVGSESQYWMSSVDVAGPG